MKLYFDPPCIGMLLVSLLAPLSLLSPLGAEGSPRFLNSTIWQALRQIARRTDDPAFIGMAVALQSPCNAALRLRLDDPNETFTLFAPVNEAFISFDPHNRMPLRMIGCGNETCREEKLNPFPGTRYSLGALRGCLAEITQYHVVPGVQFVALEGLGSGVEEAVVILPTALNSSSPLVQLAPGQSQHLVVNQTVTSKGLEYWVSGAASREPARIAIRNIQCSNGVIHGITRLLLPPPSALRTLQAIDPRPAALALRTPDLARPVTELKMVTIFWPASGWQQEDTGEAVRRSMSRVWNYTEYIVPEKVIFNNSTDPTGNMTVSMISGQQREISFAGNYSMAVDGIRIVRSNVLLDNGVLHFIERPFPTQA